MYMYIHVFFQSCSDTGIFKFRKRKSDLEWVIPENIRTLPRVASWNSEGMGGGGGGGVRETGIPKAWGRGGGFLRLEFCRHGGCFDLDFQRGKRTRDSLDEADCIQRLW